MIGLLAAVSENGVIGRANQLPWHLPADLQRFKQLTVGHTIVMGRKTYDSIGHPLPNRSTIVVSRDPTFAAPGVTTVGSLEDAWRAAVEGMTAEQAANAETYVVGGNDIFRLALPAVDRLYLTRVHAEILGDVFFPPIDWSAWELLETERHDPDAKHAYAFSFLTYRRK